MYGILIIWNIVYMYIMIIYESQCEQVGKSYWSVHSDVHVEQL